MPTGSNDDQTWNRRRGRPGSHPRAGRARKGRARDLTAAITTGQTPRPGTGPAARTETTAVNANDATLTSLATAQTGSTVPDTAPNAPANPGFDLVLQATAGSALGSCGAPYTLTISVIDLTTVTQPWPTRTLRQAFDEGHSWALSGAGPDYQCTQTFPITVPGNGPGGPLAGHTLQYMASLISPGAQIASIRHSNPFVLV